MKIYCKNCGHSEATDKDFFVKLVGGSMPVGGFWAWTTYLFAGTGFALAIVTAIITGGVAMLIYKDEITEWIINRDYKCINCSAVDWSANHEVSSLKKPVKPSIVKRVEDLDLMSSQELVGIFENTADDIGAQNEIEDALFKLDSSLLSGGWERHS